MTKEILNKLPNSIRDSIEGYRIVYNTVTDKGGTRRISNAYLKGLRDAGLITEAERRVLLIYTTV